jgi:hypothetical protein
MKYVLSLAIWLCLGFTADGDIHRRGDESAALEGSPAANLTSVQSWDAFVGTWQIVGDVSAAEEQVKTAIYKATEEMSFLTRGIARDRLISSQKPPKRIRMQRQNNMFIIHPDTSPALSMPISGEAVKYEDRMVRVSLDSGDGRLTLRQISENQQGKRENIYRLQGSGKSMDLEVTVNSSHLPAQLQYKLRFTRVE